GGGRVARSPSSVFPLFLSLQGSLYKILAKVLANRLRLVVGSVIYEAQTTFVKDGQILDGILIVNEVVDEAR
ncbi:cysteine-rich receptor-like protein kinase, partial [Trifolium medium]|nr:cysteine-rich receptor-like protein kinase [Trifolium medium]